MNKKGFTIIELVTSLTLATVIMIFLFNLVFILKDVYVNNEVRSTLLIEQAALSEEVNKFVYDNDIAYLKKCNSDVNCIDITDVNGKTKRFLITKETDNNKIQFGNYLYKLNDNASFGTTNICYIDGITGDANGYNRILIIDVPISYKNIKGNFGLKVAKPISASARLTSINTCS